MRAPEPPSLSSSLSLLTPDDPPAFRVVRPHGASAFLLTCDHASRQVPHALGTLGLDDAELGRHIGWDIGAAGVVEALAARLDAVAILQGYSRLVIDANRPLVAPDSIVTTSDGTVVPGNADLSAGDVERRVREIFHPYHDHIDRTLDQRTAAGSKTVLVSVHSFTPAMNGRVRPWHAGVLYNQDKRFAQLMLGLLREEHGLVVGDNEPYAANEATDYTIVVHAERRGLPYVELEVRQDLISDEGGQGAWADRLARLLVRAQTAMFPA